MMGRPSEEPWQQPGRSSCIKHHDGRTETTVEFTRDGDHRDEHEEITRRLRDRLGSDFVAVDEGTVNVPMNVVRTLQPEIQMFQQAKAKAEEEKDSAGGGGGDGRGDSSRRQGSPFAEPASSSMGIAELQGSGTQGDSLLPGLPDELAMCCLAHVPWKSQSKLYAVCKSWVAFLWSDYVHSIRCKLNVTENLLLILSVPFKMGPLRLTIFDTRSGSLDWDRPLMQVDHPAKWSGFLRGFRCVVVGSDLFIIGGRHDGVRYETGRDVWRLNFIRRQWSRVAPMLTPRRDFACAVIDGNVYVAGGTRCGHILPQGQGVSPVLSSVEMYNSQEDKWIPLPDLHIARLGCLGVELGGRFYVIGGGNDHGTVDFECFRSAEVFDPSTHSWTTIENMWQSAGKIPRAVAGVNSVMFAVDSDEQMLKSYDEATNLWKDVTSMPFASSNVSEKRTGNRPSHYQALGGVPGDQLVYVPHRGLLWIGPSGFPSVSLLPLQEGVSPTGWLGEEILGSSLSSSPPNPCANELSNTADICIPQLKTAWLIIGAATISI